MNLKAEGASLATFLLSLVILSGNAEELTSDRNSGIIEVRLSNTFAGQCFFDDLHFSIDGGSTTSKGDYVWSVECINADGHDMINPSSLHGFPLTAFLLPNEYSSVTNQAKFSISEHAAQLEILYMAKWSASHEIKRPIADITLKLLSEKNSDRYSFSKVAVSTDCEFILKTNWGTIRVMTTNDLTRCQLHVIKNRTQKTFIVDNDASVPVDDKSKIMVQFLSATSCYDKLIQIAVVHEEESSKTLRFLPAEHEVSASRPPRPMLAALSPATTTTKKDGRSAPHGLAAGATFALKATSKARATGGLFARSVLFIRKTGGGARDKRTGHPDETSADQLDERAFQPTTQRKGHDMSLIYAFDVFGRGFLREIFPVIPLDVLFEWGA